MFKKRFALGTSYGSKIHHLGVLGFILFTLVVRGEARLTFRLPLVVKHFSPSVTESEMATLAAVHHRYVAVREPQLTSKLCVGSDSFRLRLLDLSVSSRTLEQYIEAMCPNMDVAWRAAAEDALLLSEDFDYDSYFTVVTEKVVDVVEVAVTAGGDLVRGAVDDVLDKVELVSSATSDVVVEASAVAKQGIKAGAEVLDAGVDVTLALKDEVVKSTIQAGEALSRLPGKVTAESILVKDALKESLPKPSEVVSQLGKRLPDVEDLVATFKRVEEVLVEDTGQAVHAVVDQVNKTVRSYFEKVKTNRSLYDLSSWMAGGVVRNVDLLLNSTAITVKKISKEAPTWSRSFGESVGNVPKGFVDGTNLLGKKSPIAATREVVFGKRETDKEKGERYTREKKAVRKLNFSRFIDYLETPPETWPETFILVVAVLSVLLFSIAITSHGIPGPRSRVPTP
jgi:hypothetical protein